MNVCAVLLRWSLFFITPCLPCLTRAGGDDAIARINNLVEQARYAENYGHVDEAASLYENIYRLSKNIGYRAGITSGYYGKVFVLTMKRKPGMAMPVADEYNEWVKNSDDDLEQAYAAYLYAMIYRMNMKFDSSFFFLEKSAGFLEKKPDKYLEAKIYGAMSYNYARMELGDKSIFYGKKAFALHRQMNDSAGMAKTLILMAPAYNFLDDSINWYGHCAEGLRLARAIDNRMLVMLADNNLAIYFINHNQSDSAFICMNEAYRIAGEEKLYANRNEIAVNLADEHNYRGEFAQSIAVLQKVYADTVNAPLLPQTLHLSQKIYYDALKGLGRFSEANAKLEEYLALDEQLYQDESRKKSLEVDEKLGRSEQQRKLTMKQLQVKKQAVWIVSLGMGLLALALLALYLRKKQQADKHQIQNLQKQKELDTMKARLAGQTKERMRLSKEIHDDLGSSLTTIGLLTDLLRQQEANKDNPYVDKISAAAREMIGGMNDIIWSVNTHNDTTSSLLAHVNKYATEFLKQARLDFDYIDHAGQDEVPLSNIARRNIYLVIKEALNNIVKHSHATQVRMETVVDEQGLSVRIADNGHFKVKPNGSGQGLENMRMRMEEIGGTWQMKTGAETIIEIHYPLPATAAGDLSS